MNEMLANHYFLFRNYTSAALAFEEVLQINPELYPAKKKLIICYIQMNKIREALTHFCGIVEEDPYIIIDTDPVRDYCPCPEIIYKFENDKINIDENQRLMILGILWLYCDLNISTKYFKLIDSKNIHSHKINMILSVLNRITNPIKLEN